jgi:hypothetical protein
VSNPQPCSRRQWEYLYREQRAQGYDLAAPFAAERASSAPVALREPYTLDAWLALSEDERLAHTKQWVICEVLDGMPDRPAPMPDPGPLYRIPRSIYC